LLPGILAAVGLPFLAAGGLIRAYLPQSIANQAQEIARLRVATADSLNERGARVLIEGKVGDRMALSDRPPLVAYNEYHRVKEDDEWKWRLQRRYTPTLWVQITGGEVEVAAGYSLRSTASKVETKRDGIWGPGSGDRSYEGFKVSDPVLVLGTLSVPGDSPVVVEAEVGFETKAAYLLSLQQSQTTARWLGLLFLVLGGAITLGAVAAAYFTWRQSNPS
jgi:hypothetical protein